MALHVGDSTPEAFTAIVPAGASGFNLMTVVSAEIHVQKQDGSIAVWPGTITSQTAGSLTVTYAYQTGDITQSGNWKAYVRMTVPGGWIRSETGQFPVFAEFA